MILASEVSHEVFLELPMGTQLLEGMMEGKSTPSSLNSGCWLETMLAGYRYSIEHLVESFIEKSSSLGLSVGMPVGNSIDC